MGFFDSLKKIVSDATNSVANSEFVKGAIKAGEDAVNTVSKTAQDVAKSKIVKDTIKVGEDAVNAVSKTAQDVANSEFVKDAIKVGEDAVNTVSKTAQNVANSKIVKDAIKASEDAINSVANSTIDISKQITEFAESVPDTIHEYANNFSESDFWRKIMNFAGSVSKDMIRTALIFYYTLEEFFTKNPEAKNEISKTKK